MNEPTDPSLHERIASLEAKVSELQEQVDHLQRQVPAGAPKRPVRSPSPVMEKERPDRTVRTPSPVASLGHSPTTGACSKASIISTSSLSIIPSR